MKNRKARGLIMMLMLVLPFLESCKKYEDGPLISLQSRKERVANTWKVDNYKINGTDYTSLVTGYEETFTKEGSYSYDWGLLDGSGTWSFKNKDEEIQLTGSDGHSSRLLVITKLEKDQFWYYYMENNDKYEMHLVTK
jgi:hypothetical protein